MAKKAKNPIDTAGKTETFFTRHVRLITFLICIAVFGVTLLPVLLWGPNDPIELLSSCGEKRGTDTMTVEDLRAVAKKSKDLRMSDLDRFLGDKSEGEQQSMRYTIYHIDVGEHYLLTASFNSATGGVYYLVLTDVRTDAVLDLLESPGQLDDFLKTDE